MDRPTVKPPKKGLPADQGVAPAPIAAPVRGTVPTARIRLTSKEPPPLESADEEVPSSRPSRPHAIVTEEVTYNRRADARVDDEDED
ncbi:MAG: hypothetical protein U0174_06580 [Polyangiaceae bacterium]